MDQAAIQELLEEFCQKYGFPLQSIEFQEKAENDWLINIVPEQHAAVMIGRSGEHLIALQHILKNILRSKELLEDQVRMKIDIDSYRHKQESSILSMADDRAQTVLSTGKDVVLPPMSSFFRRLVHLHIKEKYPELTTFSRGDRSHRSVCISADGSKSSVKEEAAAPADLYAELDF